MSEGAKLEVKGHWIKEEVSRSSLALSRDQGFVDNIVYKCSECGITRNLKIAYYPVCGAKMDMNDLNK